MKFLVFAASHRTASLNKKLAVLAANSLKHQGYEALFKEYAELDMPIYNDEICSTQSISGIVNPFADALKQVQGVLIAAPEYNWSYPGSLKNIIDWTSRIKPQPLAGKTVMLMCATPSDRGGIAGIMHLKSPFEALNAYIFPRAYTLSNANAKLSGETLADAKQQDAFNGLINEYTEFTRKLTKE
ncbi:MAG: NADPH-dependent FMN reductase [Alphaproteobacteria bacterium]